MKQILQDELWAEAVEGWADKKVTVYLSRNHEEYRELRERAGSLSEKYPVIGSLIHGAGRIKLTPEEHGIFAEYLGVKDRMEQLEREYHYFLGQAVMRPFGQDMPLLRDGTEQTGKDADERREEILALLTEGRLEGSERRFRSADERNQKEEAGILALEEAIKKQELPEDVRRMIDSYVSAVNAQWLGYSEFMYRQGVEDMLSLVKV